MTYIARFIMPRLMMWALTATLTLSNNSWGQTNSTNLAWQLPVGRTIDVVMKQTMDMKQNVAGQELGSEMVSTNFMLWQVDKIDDAGIATVSSEIQRMTISMDSPQGKFDIDTQSPEELEGTAANVAEAVTQFVGKKFSQTMNLQGKVLSVDMPDEIAASNPMMSKESLSQLIKNASPVFPDKPVAVGESWNQESTSVMPGGMGSMKINSTYTYAGSEKIDGEDLDLIDITIELQFESQEGLPIKFEITSQNSKGRILFDSVKGHTHKVNIDQEMVIEVTVGPQKIDQTIHSFTEATFAIRE